MPTPKDESQMAGTVPSADSGDGEIEGSKAQELPQEETRSETTKPVTMHENQKMQTTAMVAPYAKEVNEPSEDETSMITLVTEVPASRGDHDEDGEPMTYCAS
jgi:hypothetical protein